MVGRRVERGGSGIPCGQVAGQERRAAASRLLGRHIERDNQLVRPVRPDTPTLIRTGDVAVCRDAGSRRVEETTEDEPVGAFIINGRALPPGSARHFVHVEASVPDDRALEYQVQIGTDRGTVPNGVHNMSTSEVGALYSQLLNEDQTIDLSLKAPPDYTYAHELGLYLFGPDMTYMTTWDPEAGPRASSRYGPGTEQEIVYTASRSETFAIIAATVIDTSMLPADSCSDWATRSKTVTSRSRETLAPLMILRFTE